MWKNVRALVRMFWLLLSVDRRDSMNGDVPCYAIRRGFKQMLGTNVASKILGIFNCGQIKRRNTNITGKWQRLKGCSNAVLDSVTTSNSRVPLHMYVSSRSCIARKAQRFSTEISQLVKTKKNFGYRLRSNHHETSSLNRHFNPAEAMLNFDQIHSWCWRLTALRSLNR